METEKLQEQIQIILMKVTGIEAKLDNVIKTGEQHAKNIDELYNDRNCTNTNVVKLQMQVKIISFVGITVATGLIGGLVGAFLKIIIK